jgi:hypothetical protein
MSRRVRLPIYSRYPKTKIFQLRDDLDRLLNTYAWGTWNPIEFEEDQSDSVHVVKDHELGRLDLISYQYYGTVHFWWLIAHVNDILDPLDDQVDNYGSMWVNQRIRIPSRDRVFAVMLTGEEAAGISQESIPASTGTTIGRR